MSDIGWITILVLGLCFAGAAWDTCRRAIAAKRFNQQTFDRLKEIEDRLEAQATVQQNILGKLTAATAATANRLNHQRGLTVSR